jgi:hypothetical protein
MVKCSYEMCPSKATHLAPQVTDTPGKWRWRPICSEDRDAWWEGSDPEEVANAPAMRRIEEGPPPE